MIWPTEPHKMMMSRLIFAVDGSSSQPNVGRCSTCSTPFSSP